MYYIHNKYDAESRKQLDNLPEDIVVVDFYEDYAKYSRLKGLEPLPCYLENLEYEQDSQELPTPEEQYQAAMLLNQAEILANQRQQDKVMAAILLEQVGGEANV